MTTTSTLAGLFSEAELEALHRAADEMSLEAWSRHMLLTAAGRPEDPDELDQEPAPAPVAAASVAAEKGPERTPKEPTLAEVAGRLDQLNAKLTALATLLDRLGERQLAWQRAIFAEIAAHTAFPDERARKVGLTKAERDLAAAEDRIRQAAGRRDRERLPASVRAPSKS